MLGEAEQRALRAALQAYRPFDEAETANVRATIELLDQSVRPFSRASFGGHVTAAALLYCRRRDALLLVWHAKLQKWLQPGGHCEPDVDASVHAAAWRELLEESGLAPADIASELDAPFDVDVHPVPAFGDEPPHAHHDVRFVFDYRGAEGALPREDVRWEPLDALLASGRKSLMRCARKLRLMTPRRIANNE